MTTVCCVFVRGHVRYTPEYVIRLAAMVKRWMDRPYRFVVMTDQPELFEKYRSKEVYDVTGGGLRLLSSAGITACPIEPWRGLFAWWSKINLFNPTFCMDGRVLYLDLDTLVVGPLAPILDFPAPFALIPHAGRFEGKPPRAVVKRFNSSVMVWDGGTLGDLCLRWGPAVSERLWGDQDWIGEQMPDAAMFPREWFPRISSIKDGKIPAEAKVILAKSPKNAEAAKKWRWVSDIWRAA